MRWRMRACGTCTPVESAVTSVVRGQSCGLTVSRAPTSALRPDRDDTASTHPHSHSADTARHDHVTTTSAPVAVHHITLYSCVSYHTSTHRRPLTHDAGPHVNNIWMIWRSLATSLPQSLRAGAEDGGRLQGARATIASQGTARRWILKIETCTDRSIEAPARVGIATTAGLDICVRGQVGHNRYRWTSNPVGGHLNFGSD